MFAVNHWHIFLGNAELCTIKTRNSYNLHPPLSHLTKYQKGVYYAGIRIFSHLPTSTKGRANETKEFKKILKRFLLDNSFYSMEEFFKYKKWCIFQFVTIQWHGVLIIYCDNFIIQLHFVLTFVIQQTYCVLLLLLLLYYIKIIYIMLKPQIFY